MILWYNTNAGKSAKWRIDYSRLLCAFHELVGREFLKLKKAHREDLAVERGKGKIKKAQLEGSSSEMGSCFHR